ncbi:MAG: nucleotidyltransferase domain-containing protein [Thermodesulfobacteriota bacterium]
MRNSKPPDDLVDRIPKAAACLQRHPSVVFAYLFESMATGRVTPMSDVDIAIYLSGDVPSDEVEMEIFKTRYSLG